MKSKKYAEMDKYELIEQCIQKDSQIEKLEWDLDCEKKGRRLDKERRNYEEPIRARR